MADVPNTKDADTIEMVRMRVMPPNARYERMPWEQQNLINMKFWSGSQRFAMVNGIPREMEEDESEHSVRYRANKCRGAVLRAVAKVQNVNATFRARPTFGDARHRELAYVSEKVLDHQRDVADWQWTQTLSTLWKAICGSSFVKVYWNPDKGDPDRFFYGDASLQTAIPEVMLSRPQVQEYEKNGWFEDVPTGDVATAICSPFAFFHDWTSRDKSIAGCRWVAERHYLDIPVIAEAFGIDESELQPDENIDGLLNYEEAVAFMSSGSAYPMNWMSPAEKRGKRCMYVEMWERPSRAHKRGRRIVYAGGKILLNIDNPYAADRSGLLHLPYVKDDWVPHPGRFWGASLMEDLTSPQFNLNESRSKLATHMRVFGQAATFVDEMSDIDTDNMTLAPGAVYKIPNGSRVQAGPAPQLPPEVLQFGSLCEGDLMSCAAQSEIDGAKLPGQMRSGEAVRLMNDERSVTLSIPAMTTVRTARDVGRMLLTLGQMFYDEKRLLRYMGDDNQWEIRYFTGADLTNDLVVIGQPDISDTLQARESKMLDAVAAGAFNPQLDEETRMLILKGLNYHTSDEFFTVKILAERQQEREIEQIIADPARFMDRPYPVRPWEDHKTEMRVCQRFMYGERFQALPPDTKSAIEMHMQMHEQYLMLQMQAMAEAAPSTPAPKGQPSQPRAK